MSVSVNGVTKMYGKQKALDDVSFDIHNGEIIGFLGPNGAGKSTMMKIITGYLPPSSGQVEVCGISVDENSLELRRKVGYLPEHNPLYLDMYVKEYLRMVAGMYNISQPSKCVEEMIELTGLTPEQHKKIGSLSKGYRQRVGLAQALIPDPEVLILDEPTTGLDPNQIVDVRNLIKEIGREKTVMLSTHIMQEVEAICERVIIINKGHIVADQKASALSSLQQGDEVLVTVEFNKPVQPKLLLDLVNVKKVVSLSETSLLITADRTVDVRPAIFTKAVEKGLILLTMIREEKALEDVFHELTR
ncbi:gliding motility-associated ABC transporter ATP-binding subunit GldA [Marinilabiliaceae bacterium JC017]|nr:gliding motility-associated ABC transporter ATP-binding subunit GldA [Marinilabiliaceae bacterium JC017]